MLRRFPIAALLLGLAMFIAHAFAQTEKPFVMVATIDGIINPVAAEFTVKSLREANESGAEVFILEMDTPGGLMDSMRDMIKAILASDIPVVVFVSPSGARAASAGTFITLAGHVAVMAPQTNIGAAHPVGVGEKMDETMVDKATNDAVAQIRSLAERRGRNADWAEDAVRKSVSATETEALEKNVIDLISANVNTLLEDLDGMTVETASGEKTLHTNGADVQRVEMGLRHRILDVISNPNIAYLLMLLGFYGIFFEMTNPGAIFPGVIGGICLVLAFYAFQTLPINYAGLLLILLAIIMFVLEVTVTSYGALTIGGIISMVLGSLMLFEDAGPFLKLSIYTILPSVVATVLFFTVVLRLVWKAFKRKPTTGQEGLVGEEGMVTTAITEQGGMVQLHGELWRAYADEPIGVKEKVIVESVKGLKVKVKKLSS